MMLGFIIYIYISSSSSFILHLTQQHHLSFSCQEEPQARGHIAASVFFSLISSEASTSGSFNFSFTYSLSSDAAQVFSLSYLDYF